MKIAILSGLRDRARIGGCGVAAAFAVLLLAANNLPGATTATTVQRVAGRGLAGYADGETLEQAYFSTPCGLAVDITGEYLYVADRDNNAIRQLDLLFDQTITVATNRVSKPVGVALDGFGNLYVLNSGNGKNGSVMEFSTLDNQVFYLVATNAMNLTNAAGLALDVSGNIYVTVNSNTVLEITSPGVSNVVATITNAGASLQGLVLKRSGATAGLLAVCDSGRNGVYLINPNTGLVTTNSGFHGAGDFSQSPSPSDVASASTARFNQPMGITEAGDGSLIVADNANHRVKLVQISSGTVTNLYGVVSNDWAGQYPGFSNNQGGSGTSGGNYTGNGVVVIPDQPGGVSARQPNGITIGPDGTIYATEDFYHIIREVTGDNIQVPPPWPPVAPTGPIATAGYGQVLLSWTASVGATNYNVKHSTSPGGESTIASTPGTTYTDTNVLDGATYYYVVSALNTGGESPNSTEVSTVPLYSPAPASLTVTATNYGLISLAWAPSAGATSYNLKRSTSTNGPFAILVNTVSTSYNDTSVSNGTPYYYVVTAVNPGGENPTNSNEVSAAAPFPPVPNPQIGYVTFPATTTPPYTSVFSQVSPSYEANNDIYIVIKGTPGSITEYNYGLTTNASLVTDPPAGSPGQVQSDYQDGIALPSQLSPYLVSPQAAPYLTIKAIGQQSLHPDSAVVTATFQFKTANPSINGNNAAQFTVTDITTNAQFWYTTDGSDPTNDGSGTGIGPIASGQTLSLNFSGNTNLQFRIRGFKANYQPSDIVSNLFSIANYVPNIISFGFASGEASSDFVASPGQTFYAPVTLTTLPNAVMFSMQFNLTVNSGGTNPGPALAISPTPYGFSSLLVKPIPGVSPVLYEQIPPAMFVDGQSVPNPVLLDGSTDFSSLLVTNTSINLLGVGWVERAGATNLYDTTKQTLITFSMAHDDMFPNPPNEPNEVIVGGYAFSVPTNATSGQTYQIQIGRPSATSDGIGAPGSSVFISAPTNGSLTAGAINAIKNVTVGSRRYLVGNVYPFRWFNAGDFGNTNLQNADVEQVFEAAVYNLNSPAWQAPGSDFFDAMDSCGNIGVLDGATGYYTNTVPPYPTNFTYTITNYIYTDDINTNLIGFTNHVITNTIPIYIDTTSFSAISTITTNGPTWTNVVQVATPYYFPNIYVPNLFDGNDTNINQIAFGDGVLDVCDVYVTFRRSLDTNSLVWFQRFWTNGVRVAAANYAPAIEPAGSSSGGGKVQPALSFSSGSAAITNKPAINFTAGDFQGAAGQQVSIPVTASVFGPYPLRVAMLNISVVPLDGSPALTTPISFSPGAALGTPYMTDSVGPNNYAAAWLNSSIAGISNNATIGTLTITIPANATSLSAYAVHFDHASGSPNGLASLPKTTFTGLITLSSRNTSSYNDSIPDSWRLRWFGTIYNLLSVSNACPSGDGVNNWKKYVAGVDPNTPNDFPSLNPLTPPSSGAAMSIYWPTVSGKQYEILSSASLFPGTWTTNAIVTGNGGSMEFDDNTGGPQKYYRVQILP